MNNLALDLHDENTNKIHSGHKLGVGGKEGKRDTDIVNGIPLNSLNVPNREMDGRRSSSRSCQSRNSQETGNRGRTSINRLYYHINEVPSWYLSTFLGFQHYLTMVGSTVAVPFILCPKMCMEKDDPDRANIISTLLFVSGLATLLQTTVGTRLPIIQGGSFSYIVPALAILDLPQWECPAPEVMKALNSTEKTELWQLRMREIQGSILFAAIFQVILGGLGVVGVLLKYISPLTIAPAIASIGISLFATAGEHAASNWGISLLTIFLITLFSQYLRAWKIPIPFTKDEENGGPKRYPLFEFFPVLLAISTVWVLCLILTAADVFGEEDPARTDLKSNIISTAVWFRVPYPCQWGFPTITIGAILGMLSAVLAGAIESVGDYYECAKISGAAKPPTHAINRGIFMEGIGCVMSGLWGTGNGTTSYSENIGAMKVTNVGSRRVVQAAAFLMISCALVGKVGAIFISIPDPIVGGVFCIVFAIVTAVGLSNLKGVGFDSSRNLFIIGFSIFFSLTVSQWMTKYPGAIQSGVKSIDEVLNILFSTGMFVAGLLGFILDNTIPGSNEERGIMQELMDEEYQTNDIKDIRRTYDLPFGMDFIERIRILRFLPISPTYKMESHRHSTSGNSEHHI